MCQGRTGRSCAWVLCEKRGNTWLESSHVATTSRPEFTGGTWHWLCLNCCRLWWFPDHLSFVEANSGLPWPSCPPALLPSLLSMVLSQAMIALRGLRRGKAPLLTTSEEGLVLGSQNSLVGEEGFYLASPKDLSPLTGHLFSFSQIQF